MSQKPLKPHLLNAIARCLNDQKMVGNYTGEGEFTGNSPEVYRIMEAIQEELGQAVVREADQLPGCCMVAMLEIWTVLFMGGL